MATAGSMSNNVENLSPQIIRGVVREMQDLVANPPEVIKVQIYEEDVTDIQAFIEGPAGTPYASGIFEVKLTLRHPSGTTKSLLPDQNFPSKCCRKWRDLREYPKKRLEIRSRNQTYITENDDDCTNCLLTIKCLLIVPNAESALNEGAGKLLLEHYEDYSQRARMMAEINALPKKSRKDDGPLAKKHAGDKKLSAEKKKILRDKRRTLKRL